MSLHQAWVLLEVWEGAPFCWMVKSSFLKCSFISCKAEVKISAMYTFVLTLAPCFTKIREDFQIFHTASKPWQLLASGGDKRLTCLQECPLTVGPALYPFVDWTLPAKWIFFRLKNDFTLLHARFQLIQNKTSSLSLLYDSKMLTLLWFQKRNLRSDFAVVLIDFVSS